MKPSVRPVFLVSPILLLILTQLAAILGRGIFGDYVYIPIILLYWIALAFILASYGFHAIRILYRRPQGHWIWYVIAILFGVSSLPMFLQHVNLLRNITILLPTLIFVLVNPWLEEMYWRGLLLEITDRWPRWLSLIYSTLFFMVFHSAFAWQSPATRNAVFYIAVFFLGAVMVLITRRTKSLWINTLSHMLINLLNMSIPTIMNRIEV